MRLALFALLALLPFSAGAATAPASGEKTLWHSWYTITAGGIPYGYYHDKVDLIQGRVRFQNEIWKREEGHDNVEQIGAFSEYSEEMRPLFFNFRSVYRSTETVIDGNVDSEGKKLTVRVQQGGKELPVITKSVPAKAFLSTLFPVWLSLKLDSLKPGKTQSFRALPEDDIENKFAPTEGSVKLEEPDEIAKKTQSKRIAVRFRGVESTWWIDGTGAAVRIHMPGLKTVIERVTEEKARKFLPAQ